MSWKDAFGQGVKQFQSGNYEKSIQLFTEALANGGDQHYAVYDSRAAAFEKLNRYQEALRDSKNVIQTAKDKWQGYARSARLFQKARKYDASIRMYDLAIERVKPEDHSRRAELMKSKEDTQNMKAKEEAKAEEKRLLAQEMERRTRYHFGNLPVEVAMEVFSLLIEDNSAAIITLLAVCQNWRTVVWQTPALWNTLVLSKTKPTKKLKLWLGRSRGAIRTLVVRAGVLVDLDWSYHLLEGLKWEHLRSCSIENWDLAGFLKSVSMHHILSNLHTLELYDASTNDLFVEGSILRNLTVSHHHQSFSCTLAAEKLQKLTSLTLHSVFQDGIFELLGQNPQLETLTISFPSPSLATPSAPSMPPSLPALKSLEIANYRGSVDLVSNIVCPNLSTLNITSVGEDMTNAFRSLTTSRSINLTQLILTRVLAKPQSVVNLLQLAQKLEHLEIVGTNGIANAVALALAGKSTTQDQENSPTNSPTICPNLSYLNLSRSPDLKTGPVVRIIKHRNENPEAGCRPINSLVIDECHLIDSGVLPFLRSCIQRFSCVYMTKKAAKKLRL
ncbi:hypothetical protein AX16_008092 [Volvariella volvacea WC 439]|nr:hypothetical protein AX16_008092 [Volvariella volvacea WC 439]